MRFLVRWMVVLAGLGLLSAPRFSSERGPIVQKGIVYSTPGGTQLKLDLVQPAGDGPFPLIVWFHGGGYQIGDRQNCMDMMQALAKLGYAGASIQYRLAPKHRWPVQLEDGRAALAFLRSKAKGYKIDTDRLGVGGISAGGHLALMLGLAPHEGKPSGVKAVINFCGPSDFRTLAPTKYGDEILRQVLGKDMNAIVADLLGTTDRKAKIVAEASPLTHLSKDSPPVLTLQGSADPICPLTQAQTLHEALRKVGVTEKLLVIEGGEHSPDDWPADKRGRANRALIEFLDRCLKRRAEKQGR